MVCYNEHAHRRVRFHNASLCKWLERTNVVVPAAAVFAHVIIPTDVFTTAIDKFVPSPDQLFITSCRRHYHQRRKSIKSTHQLRRSEHKLHRHSEPNSGRRRRLQVQHRRHRGRSSRRRSRNRTIGRRDRVPRVPQEEITGGADAGSEHLQQQLQLPGLQQCRWVQQQWWL